MGIEPPPAYTSWELQTYNEQQFPKPFKIVTKLITINNENFQIKGVNPIECSTSNTMYSKRSSLFWTTNLVVQVVQTDLKKKHNVF